MVTIGWPSFFAGGGNGSDLDLSANREPKPELADAQLAILSNLVAEVRDDEDLIFVNWSVADEAAARRITADVSFTPLMPLAKSADGAVVT